MKKLFIMTHNMAGGGCERVISLLANYWVKQGTSVTVLTEYRHESAFSLDENVRLIALEEKTSMSSGDIPRVYKALRRLVKKERPDAVLAMPEKVNVWAVLSLIGSGVPVIVSERNDPRRHPENRVKRMLRRFVYPFAAGFIFQTQDQRAYFSRRISVRGTVLDNPLDASMLPHPHKGVREKTVVTAARLEPQKNLMLLLRAFAVFSGTHSGWRLTVYGEGAEREKLTALAQELGVSEKVSFPGAVPNVPQRIADAGMFVLPSDFEGMPNALIEAMATGLPCIATDCPAGGPASLIINGKNGLLIPVGDTQALNAAMTRVADDPAFASEIGAEAVHIRERMDIAVTAEKWKEYIDGIIYR